MTTPNKLPTYSNVGSIKSGSTDGNGGANGPLKTANTNLDGTGTVLTVWTADATNGGWCPFILCTPAGTNVATVLRVFGTASGNANGTISNNRFFGEMSLPATTAAAASALPLLAYPINQMFDPGMSVNVAIGTSVAAGWFFTIPGGSNT